MGLLFLGPPVLLRLLLLAGEDIPEPLEGLVLAGGDEGGCDLMGTGAMAELGLTSWEWSPW